MFDLKRYFARDAQRDASLMRSVERDADAAADDDDDERHGGDAGAKA